MLRCFFVILFSSNCRCLSLAPLVVHAYCWRRLVLWSPGLLFRKNVTFQMAMILLVVIVSYGLNVRGCIPCGLLSI